MPQNTLIKSQHTLSYFTRQLISFYRHQSFLLFSLLFVVSSGTLFSQGSVVTLEERDTKKRNEPGTKRPRAPLL